MTTPSVAIAAFNEIIAPEANFVSNRSALTGLLSFSRVSRRECTRTPVSSAAISDSCGAKTPSTSTSFCVPLIACDFTAFDASANAALSGAGASGAILRRSARKSVYFQSSMRRCGKPKRANSSNAACLASATMRDPGKRPRAEVNNSSTGPSVFILANATFIKTSIRAPDRYEADQASISLSRDILELGVTGSLELQRQFLAAAFHHASSGHHVHEVRHDVVQQPLIMRDHHHGSARRAQRVDAVGGNPQRVDVEARIHFVENAKARLEQCHLQDLVALLLTAGEPDIDAAAEHVLRNVQALGDFADLLQKVGG